MDRYINAPPLKYNRSSAKVLCTYTFLSIDEPLSIVLNPLVHHIGAVKLLKGSLFVSGIKSVRFINYSYERLVG